MSSWPLERLSKAKFYTKLDIAAAFNNSIEYAVAKALRGLAASTAADGSPEDSISKA